MSDDALVKVGPRLQVAPSLERAAVGQTLIIGRHGEVLGPGAVRRSETLGWLAAGGLTGAGGAAVAAIYGGPFALLFVGLTAALMAWQLRHLPALRRAVALSSSGQRDDAYAALVALESKRMPVAYADGIQCMLASLAHLRGGFDEAAGRYERTLARLRGRRGKIARQQEWMCRFGQVELMATMGKTAEARRLLDQLGDAPPTEFYDMLRQSAALDIAFHADDAGLLPDDDELHAWARAALARTRFGGLLVGLAWAFARRGDDDMARHLLGEAPARLEGAFLAESSPKLNAWMEGKMKEWTVEG